MADIRITPASSVMSFTSSLNFTETLTQDASGSLNLYGSGSTGRTELLSIDGNNGRLFTVSDDLSDSLFSVNTIAGLPVIEAFADNSVNIGQYSAPPIKVIGANAIITGSLFGTASYATTSTDVVNNSFTLGSTPIQLGNAYNTISGLSSVTSTNFVGALSGNATTATTATNVTATANNSTNETTYLTFVDGATGTQGIETDTDLTYNPSTNILTAGLLTATSAYNGGTGTAAAPAFSFTSDTNTGMYRAGSDLLGFSTAGIFRMSIDSTGNVGIGTTSPYSKFTTYGALSTATSQISIINIEGGHTILRTGIFGISNSGFSIISADVAGTNQNTRLVVGSTGNVGIGTTSPAHKLDVYTNIDNEYIASFSQDHATGWGVLIDTDGTSVADPALWVKNTASTIMWAAQNGYVGIGSSSPSTNLHIFGDSFSVNPSIKVTHDIALINQSIEVIGSAFDGGGIVSVDTNSNLIFKRGTIESMRIDGEGKVGIGTSSPDASAILHLQSTTKGFLPPVMKESEREAISSPAQGLMIFNKDTGRINVFDGGDWQIVAWA